MKRLLVVALLLMAFSGTARADTIGVYGDNSATLCYAATTINFPVTVYVIHRTGVTGSTGSAFKITNTTGFPLLSWSTNYVPIGLPESGLQVAYGGCQTFDVIAAQLIYLPTQAPVSCSQQLEVVGHAQYGPTPVGAKCGDNSIYSIQGLKFSFFTVCGFCGEFVRTESSTWGKVKALYRN